MKKILSVFAALVVSIAISQPVFPSPITGASVYHLKVTRSVQGDTTVRKIKVIKTTPNPRAPKTAVLKAIIGTYKAGGVTVYWRIYKGFTDVEEAKALVKSWPKVYDQWDGVYRYDDLYEAELETYLGRELVEGSDTVVETESTVD